MLDKINNQTWFIQTTHTQLSMDAMKAAEHGGLIILITMHSWVRTYVRKGKNKIWWYTYVIKAQQKENIIRPEKVQR